MHRRGVCMACELEIKCMIHPFCSYGWLHKGLAKDEDLAQILALQRVLAGIHYHV